MDINYLYSIVDLYLRKESDKRKSNLNVIKIENNRIQFSFNMDEKDIDVTSFSIPLEEVFENNNFYQLIRTYKQNNIVIDEKFENNNSDYCILFNNGRKISFKNFNINEMNSIRNILYDIKFQKDEIRIKFLDEEENNSEFYFRLQPTGFANYKVLCGIVLSFTFVFILSLWVFNIFVK